VIIKEETETMKNKEKYEEIKKNERQMGKRKNNQGENSDTEFMKGKIRWKG
jgi:hypothetical protein